MKITKTRLRQIIKEELSEARYSRPDATEQDIRDAEEVLVELAEQYPGLIAQFGEEQILQGLIWWSSNIGGGKHWTKWQPALLKVLEELSKVLLPDAKLSISKTIECIANEKKKKLNGKMKEK